MTSYIPIRTASFKHHCKIRKVWRSTLFKFHIILTYIHRDMRVIIIYVVTELFDPPTYVTSCKVLLHLFIYERYMYFVIDIKFLL